MTPRLRRVRCLPLSSTQALQAAGVEVVSWDPGAAGLGGKAGMMEHLGAEIWGKLHVWSLTQYDRVVYMDADMIVLENSDELFEARAAEEGRAGVEGGAGVETIA